MTTYQHSPVLVLGPRGMLGQTVMKYFRQTGRNVIAVDERFENNGWTALTDVLLEHPNGIVVNCIGRIKQKTNQLHDLLWANAILPLELSHRLPESTLIVHPSTDCVYNGATGAPYATSHKTDAGDEYGWSKALGDAALVHRKNTLIPRVSIIGPDENPAGKGLLNWFLTQPKGSQLKGFENHLWNGITTLEWCRLVDEWIRQHPDGCESAEVIQWGTAYHLTK